MSQFWYTPETAEKLCNEILAAIKAKGKDVAVACVSCPTAFEALRTKPGAFVDFDLHLFEFDTRFGENTHAYTYYNYNNPVEVPAEQKTRFDIIIADPPHVSDECVVKYAQTIRLLRKDEDSFVIFCTALTLEEMVSILIFVEV